MFAACAQKNKNKTSDEDWGGGGIIEIYKKNIVEVEKLQDYNWYAFWLCFKDLKLKIHAQWVK